MSTAVLACPYCNAEVNVGPGLPVGHKVVCPRCSEAFNLRHPTTAVQAPPGVTNAPAPALRAALAPSMPALALRSRRSANRLVAGIVVSVMVLMAGLGLTYALMTQGYRRSNDKGLVKNRLFRPGRAGFNSGIDKEPPPSPLVALGYLPANTNVIVSARVSDLLASPAGQALLNEKPPGGGEPIWLRRVREMTGLNLQDVEELVVGTCADDTAPRPITLVVRTSQPHEKSMIATLEARPRSRPGDGRNDVYVFTAKGLPALLQRGLLWCADDRTVVVRLLALDMGEIPRQPGDGISHLSDQVRDLIARRGDTKAPLWAIGEVADWSQGGPAIALDLLKLEPTTKEYLKKVRTVVAWASPDKPAKAGAVVNCISDTAAAGLEKRYLVPNKARKGLTWARDTERLTIDWTGDLTAIRKALSK